MTSDRPALLLAALLFAAGPASAQYKVVGPDGSVTYTDRPPVTTTTSPAKVTSLNRRGAPAAEAAGESSELPFELRQVAARYPVTLYTTAECAPCDSARTLLQQRGVPYSERRIATEDDAAVLERVSGGRTVPAVTIGGQALRGLTPGDWTAYLDAAGYPRESRLPRSWKAATATPAAGERSGPSRAIAATPPVPVQTPAPEGEGEPAPPSATPGIRF